MPHLQRTVVPQGKEGAITVPQNPIQARLALRKALTRNGGLLFQTSGRHLKKPFAVAFETVEPFFDAHGSSFWKMRNNLKSRRRQETQSILTLTFFQPNLSEGPGDKLVFPFSHGVTAVPGHTGPRSHHAPHSMFSIPAFPLAFPSRPHFPPPGLSTL